MINKNNPHPNATLVAPENYEKEFYNEKPSNFNDELICTFREIDAVWKLNENGIDYFIVEYAGAHIWIKGDSTSMPLTYMGHPFYSEYHSLRGVLHYDGGPAVVYHDGQPSEYWNMGKRTK